MSVLVIGPGGRLAPRIAHAARDRGACVALATPNGGDDTDGGEFTCFPVDTGSETAVDDLFERAALLTPGLDTVIIVAAVDPLGAIHELSFECWRETVAEPLRRVFWLVRRAVEAFLADAVHGRLVLVVQCSAESREPNSVLAAALRSLARSFAREYGRRGLACNLVLPARSLHASEEAPHDPLSSVVEQVLFLASPAASFVNGEVVVVR